MTDVAVSEGTSAQGPAGVQRALDLLGQRAGTAVLLIGWLLAAGFVALHLDRGWVPHDEGAFAQSAQRVLAGELPHRDFTELYTGGMTFLNAGVFWLFGENLLWLRLPMFVLFVAFIPCVYAIARRFAGRAVAALVAALAVTWGLPLYPAAVPSWYLLFFAVFGAAALLRYLDGGRTRWLVVAGLFGGVSISFKIVGVWFVVAALLFLLFVEQESRSHAPGRRRFTLYGGLVAFVALAVLAGTALLLGSHLGAAEVFNFVLPVAAVSAVLVTTERRVGLDVDTRTRMRTAVREIAPFLAGVAAPVVALVFPFALTGSLDDLYRGVFIAPQSRLDYAYQSTTHPAVLGLLAPLLAYIPARRRISETARRSFDVVFAAAAVFLVATASNAASYKLLFLSARLAAPLLLVLGAAALMRSPQLSHRSDRRPAFLLLALAAFLSLVQFPFGAPIYFCYSVPIVALAALASLKHSPSRGALLPVALLATYVAFGFVWLDRGSVYALGFNSGASNETTTLDSRRAAIRVSPGDKAEYDRAVQLLREHSSSPYTYAGPDAPELYYLSGLSNPTPSLFAFLDTSDSERGDRLLPTLRERHVTAIAINVDPDLSERLDARTTRLLRDVYPRHERVGRFDVRWCRHDCSGVGGGS